MLYVTTAALEPVPEAVAEVLTVCPGASEPADTVKGNRPSFTQAASGEQANALYEYFCACLRKNGVETEQGVFGADMKVSLLNDGPVTICLDTCGWKVQGV